MFEWSLRPKGQDLGYEHYIYRKNSRSSTIYIYTQTIEI